MEGETETFYNVSENLRVELTTQGRGKWSIVVRRTDLDVFATVWLGTRKVKAEAAYRATISLDPDVVEEMMLQPAIATN